jgi:hypothetical protein
MAMMSRSSFLRFQESERELCLSMIVLTTRRAGRYFKLTGIRAFPLKLCDILPRYPQKSLPFYPCNLHGILPQRWNNFILSQNTVKREKKIVKLNLVHQNRVLLVLKLAV